MLLYNIGLYSISRICLLLIPSWALAIDLFLLLVGGLTLAGSRLGLLGKPPDGSGGTGTFDADISAIRWSPKGINNKCNITDIYIYIYISLFHTFLLIFHCKY